MTVDQKQPPNVGPNSGRALAGPIKGFVHRLVYAVKSSTGLSYRELDKALGFPVTTDSVTEAYVTLHSRRARAVQAASVQSLENRIAKFLDRPAFNVVVRNLGTGTHITNLTGGMDVIATVAAYKPPRSRRNVEFAAMDSRGLIFVGYEYLPDHEMMGFGANLLPGPLDIEVYRGQIERAATSYPTDHPQHATMQNYARDRERWLDSLLRLRAGNLPEQSVDVV